MNKQIIKMEYIKNKMRYIPYKNEKNLTARYS